MAFISMHFRNLTMGVPINLFQKADSLCSDADMLTGILGGESRSRPIIADVSALVRKNTLNSR